MAVILYKRGNTEVVNGVSCESVAIPPEQIEEYLSSGWVVDPVVFKAEAQAPKVRNKPGRKPKQIEEAAVNESHEG